MSLPRPPAVGVLGTTALMTLLMVAWPAAANGDLCLVEAARNRDQRAIRLLLSARADVNVRSDDGATALLWPAHWNDLEIADLLIRAGANVNAANDLRMTPLSLACTNGNTSLVERLLAAGANPNTPIATGETPIMTCASTGSAVVVGGGAGTIKGGRHLVYPEGSPLTNLQVTLLDKVGVRVEKLGDSTGTFRELLG